MRRADTMCFARLIQSVQWFIDTFRCHLEGPEVHPDARPCVKIQMRCIASAGFMCTDFMNQRGS